VAILCAHFNHIFANILGFLAIYIEATIDTQWKSGLSLFSIYGSFFCSLFLDQLYPACSSVKSSHSLSSVYSSLHHCNHFLATIRESWANCIKQMGTRENALTGEFPGTLYLFNDLRILSCALGFRFSSLISQFLYSWITNLIKLFVIIIILQVLIWRDVWSFFVMVLVYTTINSP